MSEEKRQHKRKLVQSRVKLRHPGFGEVEGMARDISNNGIFVILPANIEIPPGDDLQMQLLDSVNTAVTFNMKVVRHDKGGAGLMFVNFEVDGRIYQLEQLKEFWSS